MPAVLEEAVMGLRVFAHALLAALLLSPAAAQDESSLLSRPKLEACQFPSHPQLPDKWRATYLLAPFTKSQLVLASMVYDSALSAMRVSLYGVRQGFLDLLIVGDHTYVLVADGSTIACQDLGDTGWRALGRDWLTPQSQCAGSAPIGGIDVDWWKTPLAQKPASSWIWYSVADRSPFRLVFQSPSDRLAILSQYALSYQVEFKPVLQTGLGDLANACRSAKPARAGSGPRALRSLIHNLSRSRARSQHEIRRLMPALASCPAESLPQWPKKLALTGLMTPFDANESPYPTEVLYDWNVRGQRSRVFVRSESKIAAQDALLLGAGGYNVTHRRNDGPICAAVLPGTIRPDWPSRGSCSCEATIEGGTPLTPHGPTRIMSCSLASPRAAWAWYTTSGRPTVFMVTSMPGDEGAALFAVLDYWQWLPGHNVPESVFKMPDQCQMMTPLRKSSNLRRCSTCHLGAGTRQ